jgi:hypothetical protein
MAKAAKKTARGRKQDRARVAGGQKYEVDYEAKKTRRSASAVKKAVKKVGNGRKKVEKRLGLESPRRPDIRRCARLSCQPGIQTCWRTVSAVSGPSGAPGRAVRRRLEEAPDTICEYESCGHDGTGEGYGVGLRCSGGEDHVAQLHVQQVERVSDPAGGQHNLCRQRQAFDPRREKNKCQSHDGDRGDHSRIVAGVGVYAEPFELVDGLEDGGPQR